AIETLNAITRVKAELPGVLTILGVSNVSFGLKPHARAVLNSVFLYHAVKAGLDAAIVNPLHITPYAEIDAEQRQLAEDLIYNRPDALPHYIDYFESHGPEGTSFAGAQGNAKADPTEGMNTAERIHWQILHRRKEGIEPLIEQIIEERAGQKGAAHHDGKSDDEDTRKGPHLPATPPLSLQMKSEAAVDVLNTVLLPAMKDV